MMLIYAPCPDEEFAPVYGGITAQQFDALEADLAAVVPPVRYRKELDEGTHPAVQLFTLRVHRHDRERALPAIQEAMSRIAPQLPWVARQDRELAALLRQLARARGADDHIAAELMKGYLVRDIQYLMERLLCRAKVEWAVDIWLDGIAAQEVQFVPPCELALRGYIYAGRGSDGSQRREPFEAELRSSAHGPGLEMFVARFGDRTRLAAEGVTRADVSEGYATDEGTFSVRVGGSVRHSGGEPVEWAFEFTKE
jgi:hypothetical protein